MKFYNFAVATSFGLVTDIVGHTIELRSSLAFAEDDNMNMNMILKRTRRSYKLR